MHDLILLVGYRGVGKTTIGRQLAKSYGFTFLDTDEEIMRRRGASVADIVAAEGWQAFRRYEREVLQSLRNLTGTVVASGGGAVVHQEVWQELRGKGVVFWLTAAVEVLQERLRYDRSSPGQRPSLTGSGMEEEIADLLKVRNPLYRQTAHHCIDTGGKEVPEIVKEIEGVLKGLTTLQPDNKKDFPKQQ